jgi:hypothetical protein
MLPLDKGVLIVAAAVLAACAATFGVAATVLWRASADFAASVAGNREALERGSSAARARIEALRGDLARSGRGAEAALWALPRVDARLSGAQEELRRRRLALGEAQARLAQSRDVATRIRSGWRTLQRAIELGRMLGW